MHRCLEIHDIVCLLCDALDEVAPWEEASSNFLNMALTCRGFLDPGLNMLWKSITNLDPIISCLPGNLWKTTNFREDNYLVTVLDVRRGRAVSARDLQRYLEFYAPRIQVISFSSVDYEDGYVMFSKNAFLALQMATGLKPGALSPNLRSFSGGDPMDKMIPLVSLFVGHSVTSVTFKPRRAFNSLAISSMQFALERLPNLKEIEIVPGLRNNAHVLPWLEESIQHSTWDDLKKLKLGLIESPLAFECLAKLPKLESLEFLGVALAPSWRKLNASTSVVPVTPFFSSLRRLELEDETSVSLDTAIYIIQHLPPTNTLQYLSVRALEAQEATQGVQGLVDAITNRLQPSQLQVFHYQSAPWSYYDYPLNGLPLEPFIPAYKTKNVDMSQLLGFHQLQVIDLDFTTAAFVLPLELAVQIASAWSKLRVFHLRTTRPTRPSIDKERLESILKEYVFPLNVSFEYLEDAAPSNVGPALLQVANLWAGDADEETDTDSESGDLEDDSDDNLEGD